MSNFANLRIHKVVIHEIYKREGEAIVPPKYNEKLTRLDAEGLQTLQNRIVKALGDDSHSIEMDVVNHSEGSVFQLATNMLKEDDANYIEISKNIAYKLAESQTTRSVPGGIVLIFSGLTGLNDLPIWGIIKAEIQEGFVKGIEDENLILTFITDLLLTPLQKMYKLGVFIEMGQTDAATELRSNEDFKAYVYDHNMSRNETKHAAYYFYRDFLGCSYSPTDKKLTQDFYNETKNFIKSANIDEEIKGELNTALFTYIKVSQEQIIQTETFADEYLPTEEIKQEYLNHMETKAFPTHAISKDITYIKNKLRQRKVTFSNNVKIIAPADNFGNLLTITPGENDVTFVTINGKVQTND